jgi:hypothetical protein
MSDTHDDQISFLLFGFGEYFTGGISDDNLQIYFQSTRKWVLGNLSGDLLEYRVDVVLLAGSLAHAIINHVQNRQFCFPVLRELQRTIDSAVVAPSAVNGQQHRLRRQTFTCRYHDIIAIDGCAIGHGSFLTSEFLVGI